MKFGIAPGAMNTEEPKMTADNIKMKNAGDNSGTTEPNAMLLKTIANGTPFPNLAKMGLHIKGEMQIHIPSTTQMALILVHEHLLLPKTGRLKEMSRE